ncbi:MAG: 16S rRNA (cytidine(1402)-2'-O)-methyltransferase [Rhodospirillales bacterium]|nr:16S rRNA (cytidine(1402)-2'-O)-methyltransferase [Rhodospirillales bacterium]
MGALLEDKLRNTTVEPGLHIVSTPIGNLNDITVRAIAVLRSSDAIACEDTRVTARIKSEFNLTAPLISYHEHNAHKVTSKIIKLLKSGKIVALVSDAGTPLISDPGYKLVNAAIENNVMVIPVPGASALLAALSTSGLPTNRFLFGGFLPKKTLGRRKALEHVAKAGSTLVFFESPNRLIKSLSDMIDILGNRDAIIARELTKRHEEILRGSLKFLVKNIEDNRLPRGEVTVVIGPEQNNKSLPQDQIDRILIESLGKHSVKTAVDAVALETNLPRRSLYQRAILLKSERD